MPRAKMNSMPQHYASEPPRSYPRFVREQEHRVVAGVAAGLSAHLNIEVVYIRLFLSLSSLFGGLGVILYAALWIFTPQGEPERPVVDGKRIGGILNLLLVVAAFVLWSMSTSAVGDPGNGAFVAVVVMVAVGAVLAWRAYDRDMRTAGSIASLLVGGVLVMGGVIVIALMGDRGGIMGVVVAVLVAVLGVGILVVPLIARLLRSLVEERQDKAVAAQRADIAAHLHDSVLQTLALIQKRADDSEEVARLARRQERELRAWLYDASPAPGWTTHTTNPEPAPTAAAPPTPATFFAAINTAAGEVEDLFNVTIRPVTVGDDTAFDENVEPIVLAAREAMVNAVKHSGADGIDVYAENLAGELSVFVRDRGAGFDPAAIPADRHGVRDSITGRMERAGGTATIKTAPGKGTEVALTLAA
ncbi:PspC domain-containing protein [Corynebacterium sp. CCUG 71335]|nr:PspC domain-containing protein [Corynebacterium sp. CCUG 71335]